MEEIQERLGHTNIQITLDIYTLVTKKSINNTTKNLLVTLIFRKRRSVQKKTLSKYWKVSLNIVIEWYSISCEISVPYCIRKRINSQRLQQY